MAVRNFLKSSGIAALAAGLALAALPSAASARPDSEGGEGHGRFGRGNAQTEQQSAPQQSARQSGGGEWRGRGDGGQRAQAAPPAVVQQAPRSERSWQGRGEGGGGWQGRRSGEVAQSAPVIRNSPPQQRSEAPRGEWQGRNRSYVDPGRVDTGRNTVRDTRGDTVRDSGRDVRRDTGRNWRDGDNNRTQETRRSDSYRGDRDGNRWQNNNRNDSYRSNNNYRDGSRQSYGDNHRRWNNDWRRDNRYNWYSYRSHNRDTFRIGSYYSPYRNYSYRRLGIGFSLDALFFGSRYWIADPWRYRLPEVYGPYRWVRYYDDVLLVDIYSGEVVDVIYDFFW
jgi:hypothetical protein